MLRRPTPHVCPNLDLSNLIYGSEPIGWADWRLLRGGGRWSFVKWLACWMADIGPTQAEMNELRHYHMLEDRRCHIWDDTAWCFCERLR